MKHIDLEYFAGGILSDKVNNAMQTVIENIKDDRMDMKAKRKIKITLTFSGNDPLIQNCGILVETILAPEKESHTTFAISDDDGGMEEIGGQIPGQMSFADMERMRIDEREEDAS